MTFELLACDRMILFKTNTNKEVIMKSLFQNVALSVNIMYDFCFIIAIPRHPFSVHTVVLVHVHLHFEASHMVSIEYT